jgi:hypothetical protein
VLPGLPQLAAAAGGGLALAVGLVALLNGSVVGIVLLLGGAALLVWSVLKPRA